MNKACLSRRFYLVKYHLSLTVIYFENLAQRYAHFRVQSLIPPFHQKIICTYLVKALYSSNLNRNRHHYLQSMPNKLFSFFLFIIFLTKLPAPTVKPSKSTYFHVSCMGLKFYRIFLNQFWFCNLLTS